MTRTMTVEAALDYYSAWEEEVEQMRADARVARRIRNSLLEADEWADVHISR